MMLGSTQQNLISTLLGATKALAQATEIVILEKSLKQWSGRVEETR